MLDEDDGLNPDRNNWADELTQRRQVFIEVQKAYAYLTNPLTKAIYDEFGVPGLAVYEKNKSSFTEMQEQMRGLVAQGQQMLSTSSGVETGAQTD